MIVTGLETRVKKAFAVSGKPLHKLLSPATMLAMSLRVQDPLEPTALEVAQQRFTGVASSQMLKSRQVTVRLISRITINAANIP